MPIYCHTFHPGLGGKEKPARFLVYSVVKIPQEIWWLSKIIWTSCKDIQAVLKNSGISGMNAIESCLKLSSLFFSQVFYPGYMYLKYFNPGITDLSFSLWFSLCRSYNPLVKISWTRAPQNQEFSINVLLTDNRGMVYIISYPEISQIM